MSKRKLLPFKLMPGSWGLKGKTFEKAKAEYELDGDELKAKLIEIEFGVDSEQAQLCNLETKHSQGKITENEYQKKLHTFKKEPWVNVATNIDPKLPSKLGEVELDWNEFFVAELKKQGYNGVSEDIIIKKWFTAVCSAVAMEGGFVKPTPKIDKEKPTGPDLREYE